MGLKRVAAQLRWQHLTHDAGAWGDRRLSGEIGRGQRCTHAQPSSVGISGTNGPQIAQFGQTPGLVVSCSSFSHGVVPKTVPQYMHLR